MSKVRIVTDATAYLEPEEVIEHQITVLSVTIRFGEEEFEFGPGDSPKPLFEKMAAGPAKPSQATIPAKVFQETFERLSHKTDEILVILSSSQLNSAHREAKAAAQAFLGRCRITVIDSLSTSWGLGLVVRVAAQAAGEGRSIDDIVRLVRGILPHIYMVFFVDRLDYLEGGGRIGLAQAVLGTMLRIKPVLLVEEGDIMPLEKVRTLDQALEKLANFVAEFASVRQLVILRSPLDDRNQDLMEGLREHLGYALPKADLPVIEYDPVLACHLGPEALGVAVYEDF